jgi:hypothetical protein
MNHRKIKSALFIPVISASVWSMSVHAQEPTMSQVKTWLETESPRLLQSQHTKLDRRYNILSVSERKNSNIKVEQCILSIKTTESFKIISSLRNQESKSEWTSYIPLKDLDVGSITVRKVEFDSFSDSPMQLLELKTLASIGKTIIQKNPERIEPSASAGWSSFVMNEHDGLRVAKAIKRAAILCGAPESPF